MVTQGNAPAVHAAMVRALDIAERLKTPPMELYLLQLYYTWQTRSGDFHGLGEIAGRIATVTKQVTDPLADAIGNYYLALSSFATGNNSEVQRHAQLALAPPSHLSKLNLATFEDFNGARAISAANLWVLGYPDQALLAALQVVQDADELNHPFTTCHVLMAALLIGLATGHLQRADELIQRLSSLVTRHQGFTSFVGGEGCLAVSRGELSRGIQLLQTAIAALHQEGFEHYRGSFTVYLVEGLASAGKHEAAHTAICEAVVRADTRGDALDLSILLRVKGEVLSSMPGPHAAEAETCLQRALQLANEHGWLALELRSGIALAKLWADQGAISRARVLLEPIFSRFSEGFQTRDLLAAAKLLEELRSRA
jgi:predicted ATPase